MNMTVKFAALLIAVAAALMLAGCQQASAPGADTTVPDTTVPDTAASDLDFAVNWKSPYMIVRPEMCPGDVTEAAGELWTKLNVTMGLTTEITSDWVKTEADIPTGTLELLLGDTNRPESAAVKAEIDWTGYRIAVRGDRIVINASHPWMYGEAITAFTDALEIDADGGVIIPRDLCIDRVYNDYGRPGWPLEAVPAYYGGTLADHFFVEKPGYLVNEKESKLATVSDTTPDEYRTYIDTLVKNGYTVTPAADNEAVIAHEFAKDGRLGYVYHTLQNGVSRIHLDDTDSVPAADFSYTYEKQPGDTTTLIQYGLVMDPKGIDISENKTRLNCGQMYIMKLADNSLFVIDGGDNEQMSPQAAKELLRACRELTGVPEGEKMRISCWFVTHDHPDHHVGFDRFLMMYHSHFTLERMMYNFEYIEYNFPITLSHMQKYFKDVKYHRPHTGEVLQLADVSIEVLYTLEDLVNTSTGLLPSTDFNNTSTVIRITFDDTSFIVLGDINTGAEMAIVGIYPAEMLKTDILQVSHHCWNALDMLYPRIQSRVSLFPQSSGGAAKANWVIDVRNSATKHASEGIYYAGDETVGLTVIDGKITVTYRKEVVGTDYTGWSRYVS